MSRLEFYAHLQEQRFANADGGAYTFPTQVLGDTMLGQVRMLDAIADGELREVQLHVRSMRVSLGSVLAPSTGGTFKLRFTGPGGAAESDVIAFNATAEQFTTATAAALTSATLTPGTLTAPVAGCWVARIDGGTSPVLVELAENKLAPESFVRLRAFQEAGVWYHEIRLIQVPLAFTGTFERVLGEAPSISLVRAGRAATALEPALNEVQGIRIPRTFRGTYLLRFDGRETRVLTIEDGPVETTEALNALFEGTENFSVTQGELDTGYIEFIGELEGAPQSLVEVEVVTFEPGVLTFALPLDRAALNSALRSVAKIEVPLEIELEVVDDEDDIPNPAVSGRRYTIGQQNVTVVREQIWEELDEVVATDFLTPPQPVSYQPRTLDQVLIGAQVTHVTVRGDGTLRTFNVAHGFATTDIDQVTVMDNVTGDALVHGIDFHWGAPVPAYVTVSIITGRPTPALNGIKISVKAPGPLNAYQAHSHVIDDITGLDARIDALEGRVDSLEDLAPDAPPARTQTRNPVRAIPIASAREFFPGRFPSTFKQATSGIADLPRPGLLLPALHDAAPITFATSALPASPTVGRVYKNTGTAGVSVPGGNGRPTADVKVNGFVGWDGRVWYRLTRDAATNSYFATDFERSLFAFIVSEKMLRSGQRLSIEAEIALAMARASTSAHMLLSIEVGTVPSKATPSPTGLNLEDVVWNATPLMSTRVWITTQSVSHKFGAEIIRDSAGVFTANQLLESAWEVAGQIPAAVNFAIRGRLRQFDTQDSVAGATGFVFYDMGSPKAGIQ